MPFCRGGEPAGAGALSIDCAPNTIFFSNSANLSYCSFGKIIVEHEQENKDRAANE